MSRAYQLDLADIQGNILRGYRSAVARYLLYRFDDSAAARRFVSALTTELTTSVEWDGGKPESTLNIAFTFTGLSALGISADALEGFPSEFRQGMLARARLLGDVGESDPSNWEPLWREDVHCLVMIGANDTAGLTKRVGWVEGQRAAAGRITLVGSQDAGALVVDGRLSNKEHFGYSDGYGNPEIDHTGLPLQRGSGKPVADNGWAPVAAGELLLGHIDERGEVSRTPPPIGLFRNGTFLAYRKVHQKVGTFRRWLAEEGARVAGGQELLAAKMVGRWRDGTPLALSPDRMDQTIVQDDDRVVDFRYDADPQGLRCPLGSHIRRANPRDALGFGTSLTASRRIMRRGLPYGEWTPLDQPGDDTSEHGIIFMAVNASLREQFEFVLQQWMNYGNDFGQGNDPDPLIGNRSAGNKMVIPGDPAAGRRPHVCFDMPQFVVTRGGAYFFIPSITALRWIVQSRDALRSVLLTFDDVGDPTLPPPTPAPQANPPSRGQPMRDSLLHRLEGLGVKAWHHLEAIPGEIAHKIEGVFHESEDELHHFAQDVKTWSAAHPERLFAVMRRVKPILTIKGHTIVTRFDDVQEVLSRNTVFQVPYADGFRQLTGGRNFFLGMSDTPEYQRDSSNMRVVVRREDIPTRIAPFVTSAATRIVAGSAGRVDVVDLASQVATGFVTDYFGTPSPTPRSFAEQSAAISGYLFLSAPELKAPAMTAASSMLASLRSTVTLRKQSRALGQVKDDVLERCLVLQDAGVPGMDDETLLVNLFGLVVGAIPTTVAMVARAVDELLRRPAELALAHQAAARGDTATVTRYVSEAMRFNPLGPGVPRLVMEDYTIAKGTHRETTVKAGAQVLAALQSATFDDIHVNEPNEFRIDRPDYEYMHFGYGIHTCFGQYINMVQIPRIVEALLAQPNLRRAAGPDGAMKMAGPFPSGLIVEYD